MTVDVREAFAAWRARHARRAWKPVTRAGGLAEARFGGSPLLAPDEPWPACGACGRPLQLFVQLPLATLPAGAPHRGDGTLQLFSCTHDGGGCETWRPFSGASLARLLRGPARPVPHPAGLAPFPVRTVEGWTELVDEPHPEDHDELGVTYAYDFPNHRVTVSCPAFGIELRDLPYDEVEEAVAMAATGDKLGGWPAWVQGAEYPACPTCGRRMDLVLQLDSEDTLPHRFGDVGCGHITQCPDHPDVLAFGWACS